MSDGARIYSVEQLETFRDLLASFALKAQSALGVAAGETRRAIEEVDERLKFWMREVDKRTTLLRQAKDELHLKRSLNKGDSTGCAEQEIAVVRAERKLREAEDKVETVRRWKRSLPREIQEYDGQARRLAGFLDGDLRRSLALLDGRIASLKAYLAVATPQAAPPPAVAAETPAPEGSPET
jgi:hypothetical protein